MTYDAVSAVVWAGFRYELPGTEHCSHLLEHHLGCGTEGHDYPKNDDVAFNFWCLNRGFEITEAKTGPDAIEIVGETTTHESLSGFLDFLGDFLYRPNLSGGLVKERDIVRAERNRLMCRAQRDNERAFDRLCYGLHPATDNANIPEDEALDSLGISMIREHHRRLFHPANTAIVVVSGGKFEDYRETLERAFAYDRPFETPDEPPPLVYPPVPAKPFSPRMSRRRKTDVAITYVWRLPKGRQPLAIIAARVLDQAITSRIREKMRETYDVSVEAQTAIDYNAVVMQVSVPKRNYRAVLSAIGATLRGKKRLEFFARNELVHYIHDALTLDLSIGEAVNEAVTAVCCKRRVDQLKSLVERRRSITAEEVLAFINAHLSPKQAVIALYESEQ